MTGRRILLTGATGGLGQALVREALQRGHAVRATGRSRAVGCELATLGAEFVPLDLTAGVGAFEALVEGCQSVIHAAALSASWGPRADFEAVNVVATRDLLHAAGRVGVQRFVFVSSPSIYAAFRDRIGIGADDAPAATPLNHYARSKLDAERLVLARRDDAMVACAVRPRALVGAGDRVILPRLAELARRRRMPLPRGGRALIELTDLRDAAWAICEAEERAARLDGVAVNVSGGRPVAVRDLAVRLAAALGHGPATIEVPMPIAHLLAAGSEAIARLKRTRREPALTRYSVATLGFSQTFDPEPARRLLSYIARYDAVQTLLSEARRLAGREGAA